MALVIRFTDADYLYIIMQADHDMLITMVSNVIINVGFEHLEYSMHIDSVTAVIDDHLFTRFCSKNCNAFSIIPTK